MSGTYTQSRDLTKVYLASASWSDGNTIVQECKYPLIQRTTSFRSGRGAPQLSFDDEIRRQARIFVPTRELKPSYDTGHEFDTFKQDVSYTSSLDGVGVVRSRNRTGTLKGHIGPVGNGFLLAPVIGSLGTNLINSYGSRAISATAPTKPAASLTTALGELFRDGLPAIPGLQVLRDKSFRSLGSEFLNSEFGLKPLLNDVQDLLKSVVNSTAILEQFRRDSGRIVRRRFSFPPEISSHDDPPQAGYGRVMLCGASGAISPVLITNRTVRRVWFSGAYTYYLDVGEDLLSKARYYEQQANLLLGLRLTPEVLWELAPWSWLADWFTNIGSALSNVSLLQEDGLVIRWGYLMCHTVVDKTLTSSVDFTDGPEISCKVNLRSERKERYRATPFGFGLSLAGLTDRQWAILAALGMTRAPKVAW